ncbi:MAG: hypothetical protein SVM80_07905 [Halobacteriota archaeon]|nr:hypothetical protein [Halobacteriota archaeon]
MNCQNRTGTELIGGIISSTIGISALSKLCLFRTPPPMPTNTTAYIFYVERFSISPSLFFLLVLLVLAGSIILPIAFNKTGLFGLLLVIGISWVTGGITVLTHNCVFRSHLLALSAVSNYEWGRILSEQIDVNPYFFSILVLMIVVGGLLTGDVVQKLRARANNG